MNFRSHTMKRAALSLTLSLGLLASQALADFTVEVQVGPLDGVSAARGFLVADVDDNGFSPIGPWMIGTSLAAGETLGASDDLILAVFGTSDALPWPSDTGFGSVLSGLRGVTEDTSLAIYWIEGANDGPNTIVSGATISRLIDSGFTAPADGATAKVAALTAVLGGTLQSGDIESGSVGSDSTNLSLNTPTTVNLDAGGSAHFVFEALSGNGLSLDLGGNDSISGQVFDLDGNLVGAFSGSELNLSTGNYYLVLTETSGTAPASVTMVLISSEYQPDLWIDGKLKKASHNDLYSNLPSVQRYKIKMKRRVNYVLVLENDSFLPDNLKLTSTTLKKVFRQTIIDGAQGNVTSLIRFGNYFSGEMNGRSAKVLQATIRVKRSRKSKRRYRAMQNFYAQSTADLQKRDSLSTKLISKR